MTPQEFNRIRKDAGYTQSQLSDLIGIDSRTIRRYEAGMNIHKPVVILMELIEQGIYPVQEDEPYELPEPNGDGICIGAGCINFLKDGKPVYYDPNKGCIK